MWLDSKTNTITYDLKAPKYDQVRTTVPGAVAISNGYVACPNTLHNLQLLRWIGLPVPSPMEKYDWPGKFTPFVSQKVTANFLTVHPHAFCFSDMGTGKTLAALWAADFVMRQHPGMKCLVVAPLSTLQRVWADAIFQSFTGRRKAVVLYGDAAKRRQLLAGNADFYIINFDGVAVLRDQLATRRDISMVIIDEASAYRDGTTKRHKLARKILAERPYLWLMTGTPTPNGPEDAYGLAKLVNNAFGESFTSYRSRVMNHLGYFKWVPKPGAHLAAHRLMQPSIRFAISDCIDLPPCTVQARDVELSPDQTRAYKQMKAQAVLMLQTKQITAVNEAAVRTKCIQIACGAVYDEHHDVNLVDAAPRIKVLREIMAECREKIIIMASLTSLIHLLNKELKEYTREIMYGAVTVKERNDIIARFEQEGNPRVLIAHPGTMAHGLTLVKATTVIWYSPTDRTELYLQANQRIDRPGQKLPTTIVQLAATPIEREIYRRLAANEGMQGLILALAKGVDT